MSRLNIRKDVGEKKYFDAEWCLPEYTPIDTVFDWIVNSKMHGATHVSWTCNFHSKKVQAQAFLYIEETDAEWRARVEKKSQFGLKNLEADKIEYERLKKIFDNK